MRAQAVFYFLYLWGFYMQIRAITNETNIRSRLQQLDVDKGGISILASKHEHALIEIKDLHVGAANILKQDALSVGADLAVPKGTVTAQYPRVDALLIGTKRALQKLVQKEKAQPFGLKEVSRYLQNYFSSFKKEKTQIMGVVNANDDSFFQGSRFLGKEALDAIERMMQEGADIIDVGAVSSRPGAAVVDEDEELRRFAPIADALYENGFFKEVRLSVDSYTPRVVEYALDCGFDIVNDITGFENDELCKLTARYNAEAIIMHMQGTPQTMQHSPTYEDVVVEVYEYLSKQLQKVESFGVERIVLDIGIGFGKSLEHNIALLRHLPHFKTLNRPLLVGASRKSMIDRISPSSAERRLGGTLALHLKAARDGADILRVHDVFEHVQALRVEEALL